MENTLPDDSFLREILFNKIPQIRLQPFADRHLKTPLGPIVQGLRKDLLEGFDEDVFAAAVSDLPFAPDPKCQFADPMVEQGNTNLQGTDACSSYPPSRACPRAGRS